MGHSSIAMTQRYLHSLGRCSQDAYKKLRQKVGTPEEMKKKSKSITPTKLLNHSGLSGGADGDRTHDLLTASSCYQTLAGTTSQGVTMPRLRKISHFTAIPQPRRNQFRTKKKWIF